MCAWRSSSDPASSSSRSMDGHPGRTAARSGASLPGVAAEHEQLRVLIADEREDHLGPINEAVERLGHHVVAREVDIAEVGRATHDHRPDLAIVALHEDTEHALDLIQQIVEEASCPVIALADEASSEFVAKAAQRGVWAHMDSTAPGEMRGAIDVVLERYREWRRLL